ncbi:alpha/beta hydrolase [Mesorhizobium sp. M4B.F.Ca.ET.190.01.1.1]|uniref:alpha/beta fold hydrolase n=1 Tax=unclassified Mesorhizobium TaxID=325217 RepID=UPI000FE8D299|nr:MULTISPECIES: alpha/beta hydrolase [unclassified Mesorhizobium]RWA61750.1 MAG: alpha/beta hydrolase [Mesorhizobium sp.]RWF65110.1 MAG: alpha/beta hydrolase [Mesorhizobium sp.]TGR08127.1 alpha/beta hydrolase [Mesorhizobium sp. M4B.F.Ca.ET.200.01.1.1]TGS17483.1 alpha/beta hydrolase [Mesorhizobium sp. M4B.F.Ca.ET.190.01.1.1]TGT29809.1 alpha/beta hydrolase [Mesorhizobium sp. M4B.F.Ca.ET.172.01.1.1]
MHRIETGLFLGRLPFARVGQGPESLLIINGGQGFMMKPWPSRLEKDAGRLIRILPPNTSFVLIGYDPAPKADPSLEGMARDIAEIIGADFKEPASLMGISYGGVVATQVAARYPDLVGKLILLASAHGFSADGKRRLRKQIQFAQAGQFHALLKEFTTVFRRPWLNLLLRLRLRFEARSLVARMGAPSTIVRYLEAMLDDDVTEEDLRNISARTLILGGERDQFFGGMMEATASAISGAKLMVLGDETHMAPVERASDVRRHLEEFI